MMAELLGVGSGGSLLVMLVSDHLVRLGGEVVRGEGVLDFVVVNKADNVGDFPAGELDLLSECHLLRGDHARCVVPHLGDENRRDP
jgi:hypothetical protein